MNEKRFRHLREKRHRVGLTDPEADELGALIAESAGETYSNAGMRHRPAAGRTAVPGDRYRVGRQWWVRHRQQVKRSQPRSLEIGQTASDADEAATQEPLSNSPD